MKKYYMIVLMLLIAFVKADGQNTKRYDLAKMLTGKDLIINPGYTAQVFDEGEKRGITCTGTVWLKDIAFEEGIVELDIRGRNEFLKSFVGIVFNAVDTTTRENICFRPFNFRHSDPVRRSYSLQYTSEPEYPYERLRSDYPRQFEHEIIPNPKPEDWIHARIVVEKDSVSVYVNKMSTPSLKVKRLTIQRGNKLGLWVFGNDTAGDFANLIITTVK
jgi:hypothetical protein